MKRTLFLAASIFIASPAYGQVDLGTSASVTNPQRTGDASTGLFSSATDAVSISSGGTEMMRVNGTGVGIGTSTPGYLLDINLGDTNSIRLLSDSTSVNGFIGSPYGNLLYSSNSYNNGTNFYYEKNGPASLIQIEGWDGKIYFDTAPSGTAGNVATFTAALTVANNGNIGIGTTSPAGTLDVEGGTAAASTNGSSINLVAQKGGTSNQNGGNIILTPGTATGTGTPGRVGIGTASPANLLDIGSGGGIHITSGVPGSTSNALYNNSGTLTWNGTALGTGSVSGTTNYVPSYTGSSSIGNSVIYQNGSSIGIGMTSPATTLDVDKTTSSTSGTVTVLDVLAQSTGSMSNSFGPVISFSTEDIHSLNTLGAIGAVQDGGGSNTGDLVFYTTLGSTSTEKMRILSNGYVGMGTNNPAEQLEVAGFVQIDSWVNASTPVCKGGNVLGNCSSSIRYKENVKTFERGLDDLMRMRPVKFKWKGRDENDFGLIAEEMHDINPLYVTYQDGRIEGVKYSQLTAVVVNAVKEQQQEIADLKQEISDLKAAIKRSNTLPSESH